MMRRWQEERFRKPAGSFEAVPPASGHPTMVRPFED
jgi:hypothetical protein